MTWNRFQLKKFPEHRRRPARKKESQKRKIFKRRLSPSSHSACCWDAIKFWQKVCRCWEEDSSAARRKRLPKLLAIFSISFPLPTLKNIPRILLVLKTRIFSGDLLMTLKSLRAEECSFFMENFAKRKLNKLPKSSNFKASYIKIQAWPDTSSKSFSTFKV